MRLTDLQPRWLSEDVFSFKCPCCQDVTLLCKKKPLSFRDQVHLVNAMPEDDWDWPIDFIPMKDSACWTMTGDFASMTVTPSIDASSSGHWHGSIRNGEIV
jgi:hypothetical protein